MISRIKKSIELSAGDRRVAARMTLGFVAAVLCLMLALAGTSLGLTGAFVVAQPSPSGSASEPAGESGSIFLLNPSPAYDPGADFVEDPVLGSGTPPPILTYPKISDKFDGRDNAYHIVAVVKDPPPTALVEAYWLPETGNELTIGEMTPVQGAPNTYEIFWEIPPSVTNADLGTLTARLYRDTPSGFEQVSEHSVEARMMTGPIIYSGGNAASAAETVELTWPSQNGPLGFYKGAAAGTRWKTVVEGTASVATPRDPVNNPGEHGSNGTNKVVVFYSKTKPGLEPEFVNCGETTLDGADDRGFQTWSMECPLAEGDRPSQLTSLAAVAMEDQTDGDESAYSQEAADVHVIQPYMQRVEDMKIELTSQVTTDQTVRRHRVAGGTTSTTACLAYRIRVTDPLDRTVEGANVDVHVKGPGDGLQFGTDASSGGNNSSSSGKQKPQKAHSSELSKNCDTPANTSGEQGDHNVPGGDDTKHIESTLGTGESGGGSAGRGGWVFHLFSQNQGDTEITAWIDDEPIATDSQPREADDDILEPTEKSATNFAQWLPAAPAVTIDPQGATAAAGECQRFIVRVRGGARAVKGANVDVHATGPSNDLDFCDPGDGSTLNAPQQGTGHNAEDDREVAHAGEPPVAQHTEGQTNDAGNLIVGITSPVAGDTTVTAWYDGGEAPFDNDNQDSGEASATATTNWIVETGDAAISFLNPSGYGGAGSNVANTRDVDDAFHLVARVSTLQPVGVEFFYRSGTDPLVKIADGTRVGETDTHEAYWPVNVEDGTYTLVARIRDTNITAEQSVTVRNEDDPFDPTVPAVETLEIVSPPDGARATFVREKLTIRGVASAGAEGVYAYYTKGGPLTTPAAAAWTQCGTTSLATGSAPQEFTVECTLAGSDQPALVTGVAAVAYNCFEGVCQVEDVDARESHSGDAHRVIGTEANPLLVVEPAEAAAPIDTCQKFVVTLQDQTRQPIPGQNLDAHLVGPGGGGNFCAPEDGTGTPRRAPNDGGHLADGDEVDEGYHEEGGTTTRHTEGQTTGNGRFVFGIESATQGDSQVIVWLDDNDNDAQDQGETVDTSIMHWQGSTACDITGTSGADELQGTDASETICGFGGNDTIRGGGGDDVIGGGAGNDRLRGNAGSDRVRGGAGRDRVFGGGGGDRLSGGGGGDVVNGHTANDRLRGNRGNDRLKGGRGRDNCGGGAGRDRLRGCETGARTFAARTRPI
ncbi:MAG TPA: calcium-binding protein [Actinomycetota bacterium]|nr:calcium-binding protein [Actinomycetota bacterium]